MGQIIENFMLFPADVSSLRRDMDNLWLVIRKNSKWQPKFFRKIYPEISTIPKNHPGTVRLIKKKKTMLKKYLTYVFRLRCNGSLINEEKFIKPLKGNL